MALFGSYWISSASDLSPSVAWSLRSDEYLLEIDKLALLTPDEIAQNRLSELYDLYQFRARRLPIDIHLVERMSQWRQLALDSLGAVTATDDALVHRLISNLFLVRYLEDSNLLDVNLAASAAESSNILEGVKKAFVSARRVVGSSALPQLAVDKLAVVPLRSLVTQLYGYESYRIRYDFRAMSSDVLGRFYEEYLRRQPASVRVKEEPHVQPLIFPREWEFSDIRSQRGIYYTPRFIVDYVVKNLLERLLSQDKTQQIKVLDLACGSGTFLAGVIDWLAKNNRLTAETISNVYGTDVDPRAIDAARVNMTVRAISGGVERKDLQLRLAPYNVLDRGVDEQFFKKFLPDGEANVIVGNPPFIDYETLTGEYDAANLTKLFETAAKRFDSHIFFLEAAVRLLADGGFCGFVLPSGFLRSAAAAKLRAWLSQRVDLLEIIDFGDQPVFQGVAVYVCLLLFRKKRQSLSAPQLAVAKVRRLSPTPATQLATLAVQRGEGSREVEVFFVPQPSGQMSWVFRNPSDRAIIEKVRLRAKTLKETTIDIRQGIKTGK